MMRRHCLHLVEFSTTLEPSDEACGSMEKICCNCGKIFNIMFTYKLKPQEGHGPYHVVKEMVFNNWPDEKCLPKKKEK